MSRKTPSQFTSFKGGDLGDIIKTRMLTTCGAPGWWGIEYPTWVIEYFSWDGEV
jgi:hypothetical protein